MHPAFSVIFLTTLIGVGQGLFLALYTGQLYSVVKVLPVQESATFYGLGSLIALVFLLAGLFASLFHLGHPERAWRSAARWRTSWLSREVVVLPAFIAITALYGLIHFLDLNPVLFTFRDTFAVDLSLLVGAVNTAVAFTLFLCTGMIYACIKFLQEWASPLTVVNYTLLGSTSGFTLATAFAAYQGSDLTPFYGGDHSYLRRLADAGFEPASQRAHQTQINDWNGYWHPSRQHSTEITGFHDRIL